MNDLIFSNVPRLGIGAIFNEAQMNATSHPRLKKELKDVYSQNSPANFMKEFLKCIAFCLSSPVKNPHVDRALDFAAMFLAENHQGIEALLVAVFHFIIKNNSCKSLVVRYRCCDFVNRILISMDNQAGLDVDLFEKIATSMLERLQDKVPSIRSQAVMALQRLQNPNDSSCPIIKAFLFSMEFDPSADVRAKVVKYIATTRRTLPVLFGRISDVNSTVRKEAFKTISRIAVVKLSIKQRQEICSVGVRDKSEMVKNFVLNNLITAWHKNCDCNYLTLLKVLFVEKMDEDVLETILFKLFKKQSTTSLKETVVKMLSKEKLLPVNALIPENVTLWFFVIKYLISLEESEDEKEMSSVMLPELTRFAKYLKEFNLNLKKDDLEKEFITVQLFKIASTYSFDDEMGREQLKVMCINYLMDDNVKNSAIPVIVRVLEKLVPNVKDRLMMVAELISDIREPLQPSQPAEPSQTSGENDVPEIENQLAQLSCESLDDDRQLKTDPETLVKCLNILLEVLKAKDITKIDATLLSLKDHFILECLKSDKVEVLNLSQNVIALFCIWSLPIAKEYFLKFCFQLSVPAAAQSALTCVVDILLVHGFDPFAVESINNIGKRNKKEMSLNDLSTDPTLKPHEVFIVSLVSNFLDNEVPANRVIACQALAKLMLAGHLNSSLVLARLILIWFDPKTASEPEIRQPLGVFFNVFATKRRNAGTVILHSLMPLLKAVDEMSVNDEDEEEIDPLSVAKLVVDLLRHEICLPPSNFQEEGSYHLRLVSVLIRELLIVNGYDNILLSKLLQMIKFQPEDAHCCSNLHLLVCRGIKKMGKFWDKRVLKTVQKLKSNLETLKNPSPIEDEKSQSGPENIDKSLSKALNRTKLSEQSSNLPAIHETLNDEETRENSATNEVVDESEVENESGDDLEAGNGIVEDSGAHLLERLSRGVVEETLEQVSSEASDEEMAPARGATIPESGSSSDDEPVALRRRNLRSNKKVSSSNIEPRALREIGGSTNVIVPASEDEEDVENSSNVAGGKRQIDESLSDSRSSSLRPSSSNSSTAPPRTTRSTRKRRGMQL